LVAGILATTLLLVGLATLVYLSTSRNITITVQLLNWITTGAFLSFPLSMLVYVGIRFKEIVEVQEFLNKINQIPNITKTVSHIILDTKKEDKFHLFSLK